MFKKQQDPQKHIVVACVQTKPVLKDVKHNLSTMLAMFPENADIIVYPELATTGYNFSSAEELEPYAETANGKCAQALIARAKEKNCHIIYGFAEKLNGNIYNSASIIGPESVIYTYRKMHLFDNEFNLFTPGFEGFKVIEIAGIKVGLMICFDWIFPESARTLSLMGAELICHCSNLVLPYCQDAMITRCLENRIFAATCNRVGTDTNAGSSLSFTGLSQVVTPKGKRLCQCNRTDESVVMSTINPSLARNKWLNTNNNLFEQRRPDFYTVKDLHVSADMKPYRKNVAMIVLNEKNLILAGERANLPGVWQIPQGGIDASEKPSEAAIRELLEETGTDEVEFIAKTNNTYRYDFPDWLQHTQIAQEFSGQDQIYFVYRIKNGIEPDPEKGDGEFTAFRWMTKEELLENIVDFKKEVYSSAFIELGKYLN